jgi:hypothetical protein
VGKGLLHGLMDLHSMDCGKMEDVTDGENYTVLTDFNMMEIGWKMQWKVEVGQSILTDNNMMEYGWVAREMVEGQLYLGMVLSTKVNSKRMVWKVRVL